MSLRRPILALFSAPFLVDSLGVSVSVAVASVSSGPQHEASKILEISAAFLPWAERSQIICSYRLRIQPGGVVQLGGTRSFCSGSRYALDLLGELWRSCVCKSQYASEGSSRGRQAGRGECQGLTRLCSRSSSVNGRLRFPPALRVSGSSLTESSGLDA